MPATKDGGWVLDDRTKPPDYDKLLGPIDNPPQKPLREGGSGSGFYGHAGRPGKEGGSAPGGIELKKDVRFRVLASGKTYRITDVTLSDDETQNVYTIAGTEGAASMSARSSVSHNKLMEEIEAGRIQIVSLVYNKDTRRWEEK